MKSKEFLYFQEQGAFNNSRIKEEGLNLLPKNFQAEKMTMMLMPEEDGLSHTGISEMEKSGLKVDVSQYNGNPVYLISGFHSRQQAQSLVGRLSGKGSIKWVDDN